MINRLTEWLNPQPEPARGDDFFEIECGSLWFAVPADEAAAVERALERVLRPRWIAFRDLTGARHRVRTRDVTRVSECTAAQRAAARAFSRAREKEREDEQDRKPWDDD